VDKEQAQNVVRDHRKKERELVKQGKKPFYLKKGIIPFAPLHSEN
jgi:ribosomal RNA-processing protein 36